MKDRKTRKLACIVTGRTLLATKEYYDRKVQKAGGEENLHNSYICKQAKNLLIKGYTVDKIRDMLNVDISGLKDVSQETITKIINSRRSPFRKVNIFNTSTNLLNFKTDPDVKKLIDNLKNE